MSPLANGLKYRLFRDNGNIFVHPNDKDTCAFFHSNGEECPCECWEFFGEATLPVHWHVQRGEMITETGAVMNIKGRYWEVLSFE